MKILYVTPFYMPAFGFGGPIVVSHAVAKWVAQEGHDVTVLTTDAFDEVSRVKNIDEFLDGVQIHRLRNVSPQLAKNMALYLPQGLAAYIKKNISRFQIVHLHAFFTYLNVFTTMQCRKKRIPYILHLHESPVPLPVLGKVFIKTIFNTLWGKRMLTGAAQIVVVSKREKELLVDYIPELSGKIQIIPNQLPEHMPEASGIRSDFNLLESHKVLLSLSRLSRIKRIDRVIRALQRLVQTDTNYRLLIAGPDEAGTGRELENLVRELNLLEYVQFLGPVTPEQRAKIFGVTDVYVLFSAYESFSISSLEALHYQIPVCLSKEVGIAADIIPYGCGLMVSDADDSSEASNAIRKAYQERRVLSNQSKHALRSMTTEDFGAVFLHLYTRLVQ